MELKGSKTEKNLWEAFAGESMARNKYTYFASAAKKAGYEQIAAIFQETADNEKEHAKLHFKALSGIGDTEGIAKVEAEHEKRYRELAKNVEDGTVFAKGGKLFWKCRNCGAVFELDKAPEKCPVCQHPQAYFEIQAKNW